MLRNDLQVGVIAIIRTAHPDNYEKIADGWKMSVNERRLLTSCGEFLNQFKDRRSVYDIFTFAYFNNLDEVVGETLLAAMDRLSEIDRLYEWFDKVTPLPINGNDVMVEGWEGKEIGQTLGVMRGLFFTSNFKYDREQMLDILSEHSLRHGKEIKNA